MPRSYIKYQSALKLHTWVRRDGLASGVSCRGPLAVKTRQLAKSAGQIFDLKKKKILKLFIYLTVFKSERSAETVHSFWE